MRAVSADAEDGYMLDVMIVGGGPAGMTAGLYAARMGLSAAVMEQLMVGGQASTTSIIENYPGYSKGIGGPELMMEFQQQAENAGCEVRYDGIESLDLTGEVKRAEIEGRYNVTVTCKAQGQLRDGRVVINEYTMGVGTQVALQSAGISGVGYCVALDYVETEQ